MFDLFYTHILAHICQKPTSPTLTIFSNHLLHDPRSRMLFLQLISWLEKMAESRNEEPCDEGTILPGIRGTVTE